MASLAKTLMDVYYGEELKYRNQGEYEIANAYGDGESMVNNLMHGRANSDWVPQFVKIMRERAADESLEIAEHFELIASLAEDSIS